MGTFSTIKNFSVSNPQTETTGEIARSEKKSFGIYRKAFYDIRYSYTVDNMSYIGSQINYNTKTSDVAKTLKKYPTGKQVTVYYDSSSPHFSILEKSTLGAGVYGQIVLLIFGFILLLAVFYFSIH